MFHVNHEPGAEIHHTDPFAVPAGQRSPVRRLRGRLAAPVTLWTAPGPAGLTVSSTLVAEGEPDRLLGLIDAESDLWAAVEEAGRFAVAPLGPAAPAARRPVRRPLPVARRALRHRRRGPRPRTARCPTDAGGWAGCRLDTAREYGWAPAGRGHHRGRRPGRGDGAAAALPGPVPRADATERRRPVTGVTWVTRRSQPTVRRSRRPAPISAFPGGQRALLRCAKLPDACEGGDPQMSTDTPASAPPRQRRSGTSPYSGRTSSPGCGARCAASSSR